MCACEIFGLNVSSRSNQIIMLWWKTERSLDAGNGRSSNLFCWHDETFLGDDAGRVPSSANFIKNKWIFYLLIIDKIALVPEYMIRRI